MFIKQLSIFVENKHGRLEAIIDALGKNGVNISALSIADTTDFGILRLIVDDTEKAKKTLNDIGVIAKVTDVIAVYIDDRTGGLASVLKVVSDGGVSIEYMYAFLGRTEGKALMVLKADDEAKAEKILTENGIKLAAPNEI
ncbi:MAG: ACT domain-containing protein [Clostridia bacterium]|nr:ACT domain-containing protein [Clostridia bacterium]